jgi:hypothetical protein
MGKKNKKSLFILIMILTLTFPMFFAQAAWSITSIDGFGLPDGSVYAIIANILNWLLAIIGIMGIIGFLISGGMYILSSGDDKMAGTAKNAMVNSIIGIIVALSGYVIIQAIDNLLGAWFF